MINRKILFFFLAVFCSCHASKLGLSDFRVKETLSLKFSNDTAFSYLYSHSDTLYNTLIYSQGVYSKDGNQYTLHADSINNNNFPAKISQEYQNDLGHNFRIKIMSDLTFDHLNEYKLIIHLDDKDIFLKGVKIDTLINNFTSKNLSVEIKLPERYTRNIPSPSFTAILTKDVQINSNSNFIDIHIPVRYETFYYHNIGIMKLKDMGSHWLLIDNGKKIKKAKSY